jgi:dihydroxyacetone kinase
MLSVFDSLTGEDTLGAGDHGAPGVVSHDEVSNRLQHYIL